MHKKERKTNTDFPDDRKNVQLVEHMQQQYAEENASGEITEAMGIIASAISKQYYAIYHIWVESHTYICFNETRENALPENGEKGDCDPALDFYIENYIEPEDQAAMRVFTDLSTINERLRDRSAISHAYRQNDVGWTRGKFIVGKRDKNGNVTNVIFSVANINEEVELEGRQKQAIYEAEHDRLTGIYNRKGFENVLTSDKLKTGKVGFGILDIDNFKLINDKFGHIIGDQVLIAVAAQLTAVFFKDDIIARIGGDEFIILLRDCDASAWDRICLKLRIVHTNLAGIFQKELQLSVTLSAGLSFSEAGYSSCMHQLADEGLYNTKRLGRAGCTLIGPEHQLLNHWHDETLSMFAQNVLEFNNTGLCQIEIPDDRQKPRRLICGDVEKSLLGVSKAATPEECYAIWRDRIEPSYRETLFRAEQSMIECGQTECTFLWKHPEHGTILLRCGGFGEKQNGKTVLTGYCHPLTNTHIIEKQSDQALVLRALNDSFVASYYIDFEKGIVSTIKMGPEADYMPNDAIDIPELLNYFIYSVVDPRDRELMQRFSDVSTLQERLRKGRYLDVDYRSMVAGTWCRARLLPVRFDQRGMPSHVLLTITGLDSGKLKEVYTLDYDRRSLASLFNHIPGGVVMYEWDGKHFKTIHISDSYKKKYGRTLANPCGENSDGPDFKRVHPDDLPGYKAAIRKALEANQSLHYIYRTWDEDEERYLWTQIDAAIIPQSEGVAFVYALYTDVTKQKELEISLSKQRTSLNTALHVSNQLCYEYDPAAHTCVSLTDDNFMGFPNRMENYPESARERDMFHPDDVEVFIKTVHSMDYGKKSEQCDVRLKTNGAYVWYSVVFHMHFDPEKGRNIIIVNVTDISLRKAVIDQYRDRLRSVMATQLDSLALCSMNLTANSFEILDKDGKVSRYLKGEKEPSRILLAYAANIIDDNAREQYLQMFDKENLTKQAEEGKAHIQLEYLMKMSETHYEWLTTSIDFLSNPITGEICGIAHTKSSQMSHMTNLLLGNAVLQECLFAATVFADTDEYYLYDFKTGAYHSVKQDFWNAALKDPKMKCSDETIRQLKSFWVKEDILRKLDKSDLCSIAVDAMYAGEKSRVELRIGYLDNSHTMLQVSLRNITDYAMLEKYRYESEHDELTELYNRRTMFRKCQELLAKHPEETFAMVHFDIKRFRLYNTFFDDEAGDKLLCHIANILRQMDQDNPYWVYGRIEADVFAVFFPYRSMEGYQEYLVDKLGALREYNPQFQIETAIGAYLVTNRDMSIESMFTRASLAAKAVQSGAPCAMQFFDEAMENALRENHEIISELETAIKHERFKVYLQPQYDLQTSKPIGAEALVRWIHPVKGLLSPGQFIPVLESNGSIAILDRYMWEHTCQLLSNWKKTGQTLIPISVNVSRISAYSQDTVPFLKDLVEKYDIEPKYLELELTESSYVENPEEIRLRLSDLQDYGFKILMDDFGSGYSSLNTLKNLPFDILKLDMKFLFSADDERGKNILFSVIKMSKLLNLPVIAEGIESEQQASYLKSIGCEYAQGYLYARPMPVSDYEKMILNVVNTPTESELEISR